MFEVTCLDAYGKIVNHFTQWDINQTLTIKDSGLTVAPTFHFCNKNSEEALIVDSTIDEDGVIMVKVPNILLAEPYPIIAYIYAYATTTSAKTLATIRIPVEKRVKPSDYAYDDDAVVNHSVPIEIHTEADYKNMSEHDSKTLYLVTTARNFKLYLGELPISSGGFAGEVIHQLNGGTSYVCGRAEPIAEPITEYR